MNPIKSTSWLSENIDKVKILDATWHMPNLKRNALIEFQENHIENSVFFDLEKILIKIFLCLTCCLN